MYMPLDSVIRMLHLESNLNPFWILRAFAGPRNNWTWTSVACPTLASHGMAFITKQMSLEESNTKKLSRKNGLSEKNYRMIQSMKMSKSSQKCAICIEVFENGTCYENSG